MGLFRHIGRVFKKAGRGISHGIKRLGKGVGRIVRAPVKLVKKLPRAIKHLKIGKFLNRTIFRPIGKAVGWVGKTLLHGVKWVGQAVGSLIGSIFHGMGLSTFILLAVAAYIAFKVFFSKKSSPQPVFIPATRSRFQR